jgi:excisionase family DNA binding protein
MRLLTVKEVARILGVREQRVYQLIREHFFPEVRIGRQIRVSEESVLRFVESGGMALPGGWRRTRNTDDPDRRAS